MSLCRHVADKDDVLDGIVEDLWAEIPLPATGSRDDEVVRTALLLCVDCDMSEQFDIGIDLMIRGLDSYLAILPNATP